MSKRLVSLVLAIAGAAATVIMTATPAAAAPPVPRLKPERPNVYLDLLSEADERRLRGGLRAASKGDWRTVIQQRDAMVDPAAAGVLTWRAATSDSDAAFSELAQAVRTLEGWPRHITMRDQAESKIARAGLSARDVIAWFDAYPPVSGEGRVALVDALFDAGRTREAAELLSETWRTSLLSRSVQNQVERRYRSRLSRADHEARVDFLLWNGYRSSAGALLRRLSAPQQRLAEARIALMARRRGVDRAVAAVPRSLQDHPGLLYERARWRRRSGRTDAALPLLLQMNAAVPDVAARKIWIERRIHIGRLLRAGDYDTAYQLAAAHGLAPGGVTYADAEWKSGWLALQRQGDLDAADAHFANLAANVRTPISTARAAYWRGRTAEARDDRAVAFSFYRDAATHVTTYYGQLAKERLVAAGEGAPISRLPREARPSDGVRLAFHAQEQVRALRMLAAMDEPYLFRIMSFHLDDSITDPNEVVLLAEIAQSFGEPDIAVRGGKAGAARGALTPGIAYPIIDLPNLPNGAPEPALLLALMRQESEFEPRAVSRAGARGIMQLLPSTALRTARSIGQRYRRSWLTDDPEYNILIGSQHLADLSESFDGSYVLMAAAYNAGSSRARRWIRDYGDPRDADVDVVDWVESIPFRETRDYVQRVLESMTIYRARLSNGRLQAQLTQDLRRGAPG